MTKKKLSDLTMDEKAGLFFALSSGLFGTIAFKRFLEYAKTMDVKGLDLNSIIKDAISTTAENIYDKSPPGIAIDLLNPLSRDYILRGSPTYIPKYIPGFPYREV